MTIPSSATDFFSWQDYARRQTTRLLVMFALSVLAIIVAIYLFVVVVAQFSPHDYVESEYNSGSYDHTTPQTSINVNDLWNPPLLAAVSLGAIIVISLGSLYKISALSSGGESVALMMGGRLIDPQTTDPAQRRLLNVVEEMSIASGVPVPPVFLLENETGINAFAAGFHPHDAVVAVSQGALTYLTREELQGVIGHEFSHILNGDMRLNLRLIGLVYGILVMAIIGYYLMRSMSFSSNRRSSGDNKSDGSVVLIIILVGLAMYILGYIGVFFGNWIKSAISRQREYLADASSVQFTRNPSGIAGALKKIGGLEMGSRIREPHAGEISHMFFSNALSGFFFATHPPLVARIRRLDPAFDGTFPQVKPVDASADSAVEAKPKKSPFPSIPGIPVIPAIPTAAIALDSGTRLQDVGRPQSDHLDYAEEVLQGLPPALTEAAHEPLSAQALIYALLLARNDQSTCDKQLAILQSSIEAALYRQTGSLVQALQSLDERYRLPLVSLTVPALRHMSPAQYQAFRQTVVTLIKVDGQLDLFEYCLSTMLFSYLDVQFHLRPAPTVRYRSIDAVQSPLATILSALAYAGQTQAADIQKAFLAGGTGLSLGMTLLPDRQCTFANFDAALGELAQADPLVKRQVLAACMRCIAADGKTTLKESELLRTIAAVLGCPLPPALSDPVLS